MNADPLAALLVDADAVDREFLAATLDGLVAVDAKSGRIVYRSRFAKLSAQRKIVVLLLARKAARLLSAVADEGARPREIAEQAGLNPNTTRPALKHLADRHLVHQRPDGAYFIDTHQLNEAVQFLGQETV